MVVLDGGVGWLVVVVLGVVVGVEVEVIVVGVVVGVENGERHGAILSDTGDGGANENI